MKKAFFIFGVLFSLVVIGLFASAQLEDDSNSAPSDSKSDVAQENVVKNVPTPVQEYLSEFVEKRGVAPSDINFVKPVDFDSLPKEVNIENVGDHNLAIYEIGYNENGVEDNVYVVTYSVEQLKAQGDIIVAQDKRNFLNFGFSGTTTESRFLKTASDVDTSLEKGYVMVRDGSITALSTNLEVFQASQGDIEIIIYVNGEPVGFGNLFSTEVQGVKKDYGVQAKDTVTFKAGDVVSVYAKTTGSAEFGDVITMVEITTSS